MESLSSAGSLSVTVQLPGWNVRVRPVVWNVRGRLPGLNVRVRLEVWNVRVQLPGRNACGHMVAWNVIVQLPGGPLTHSTCPNHMTGLMGWWRRLERDGKKGRKGDDTASQTAGREGWEAGLQIIIYSKILPGFKPLT